MTQNSMDVVQRSDFEEMVLPSSVVSEDHPELPTVNCDSEVHLDVSPSRKLREGQQVSVFMYRVNETDAWSIQDIQCIRCGSRFPAYDQVLLDGTTVAIVSGELRPTKTDVAVMLKDVSVLNTYTISGTTEKKVQT